MDLCLHADSPGKAKEPNCLPAPKAKFGLMLRLYWPMDDSPSIIDGTWEPPAISCPINCAAHETSRCQSTRTKIGLTEGHLRSEQLRIATRSNRGRIEAVDAGFDANL